MPAPVAPAPPTNNIPIPIPSAETKENVKMYTIDSHFFVPATRNSTPMQNAMMYLWADTAPNIYLEKYNIYLLIIMRLLNKKKQNKAILQRGISFK